MAGRLGCKSLYLNIKSFSVLHPPLSFEQQMKVVLAQKGAQNNIHGWSFKGSSRTASLHGWKRVKEHSSLCVLLEVKDMMKTSSCFKVIHSICILSGHPHLQKKSRR